VKALIGCGANVNAKDNQQLTPLHLAATLGKTEVVTVLVQHGADIGATYKDRCHHFVMPYCFQKQLSN
jgi:ankyrin repeat protein